MTENVSRYAQEAGGGSPVQCGEQMDSRPFIIFLHIQKTAGITFQRILRRNFGPSLPRRVAGLFTGGTRAQLALVDTMKSKTRADRFFAGHVCYGAHHFLPSPYTYVCFLRDPISRLLSLYNYSRENPTAYYHGQAANMSPDEFFTHSELMELDNGQVRFLAGSRDDPFINRTPYGECGHALLKQALENIDKDFAFVGITERFDASLLLMRERVNLRKILYLPRNTGGTRTRLMPSDEVLQDLTDQNLFDRELYLTMCHRLELLIQERAGFEDVLRRFQRHNQVFQAVTLPAYNSYDRLKARLRGQVGRPI